MAKGIGPLLLLAGAATLFLLKKKEEGSGADSGMRVIGDCEGIEIVDIGDAFEWMVRTMGPLLQRDGIDVDTLEGLDPAEFEVYLAEMFSIGFPSCQWPPANPDQFQVGKATWKIMVDKMGEQLGRMIGEPALAPGAGAGMGMNRLRNLLGVIG